ncbi:peptidoglycan editing factor PgeF [Legionella dresdenensis]|uniref:Purine nucleoside phosphorylase n=1 Tax=Legionella dresdenensis TaxID=450200 RepID=A0ABV8CBN1_9GAMM
MFDLPANWPAPANVRALTTTRQHGVSQGNYASNNLGLHVNDNAEHVFANRASVIQRLTLPSPPAWLDQIHSTKCVLLEQDNERQADAAITRSAGNVIAIMTADCLPILLCNRQGTEIAGIHAGWRGLVNGIIENTLTRLYSNASDMIAWIGPSICGKCYEVGDDVRNACLNHYAFAADYFMPHGNKWLANMPAIAEAVLKQNGIGSVYQSGACTFEEINHFYSYRRDQQTGRMVSLIWFN